MEPGYVFASPAKADAAANEQAVARMALLVRLIMLLSFYYEYRYFGFAAGAIKIIFVGAQD
jgi:hypothetical protein